MLPISPLLNSVQNEIDNNRSLQLNLGNGISISSIYGIENVITHIDFEKYCPLRCPGLNNSSRSHIKSEFVTPDSCAVCTDKYSEKELTRTLPCNHSYHATCIDDWILKRSSICPICKFNLHKFVTEKNKENNITQISIN